MSKKQSLGGVIHTYQKYDPKNFPSPTEPPPDLVSPAFEHMLMYGSMRELTDEELARAIHLDPSQIAGGERERGWSVRVSVVVLVRIGL